VIVGGVAPFRPSDQTVTDTECGTTTTFGDTPDPGEAIDLSEFRVTFDIRRGDFQTPNSADVRIYNVSNATANRLTREFTRIVIQAGYEGVGTQTVSFPGGATIRSAASGGNFGLLFDGVIKQARVGRDNATDSYVDIRAADGDAFYNWVTISDSVANPNADDGLERFLKAAEAAATTAKDAGILRELREFRLGYKPELSQNRSVRGHVYYGLVRDELREWAENNDVLWSIQDGKLTLIPMTSYIPGEVPVISPNNGLVGVPEQTQGGLSVRVLLNPSLKIGQRVKLDSTVNQAPISLDVNSQAKNIFQGTNVAKLNADGLYYVMEANHRGDTRGEEWYTDLTCLAVDATVPPEFASKAAIAPEAASIRRN
jgi:hypothetical protein